MIISQIHKRKVKCHQVMECQATLAITNGINYAWDARISRGNKEDFVEEFATTCKKLRKKKGKTRKLTSLPCDNQHLHKKVFGK